MHPDSAMIFAAGFGTRMGALTNHQPKPMIKVGNTRLIDHSIALVKDAGIRRIVVNTHYLPDDLEQHLQRFSGIKVIREQDILETGGGLRNALPHLGIQPVFTLNSDMVWTGANPLLALQRAWQPEKMDVLMVVINTRNAQEHKGAGDFQMDVDGGLTRRGDRDIASFVYTGVQIIKTEKLQEIKGKKFSLNVLWDMMLNDGRAFGIEHTGGWVDVGRPESIAIAQAELAGSRNV